MIIGSFRFCQLRWVFVAGLLLAAASAGAGERQVLVLGDSISAAYGMSLEAGWVARAEAALRARGYDVSMINASISGETSAGGRRRLPTLLARHEPAVVVLELGGNDGLRGYPVEQLRRNLRAMIDAATATGAAVLLLPMEIPPNYGPRYTRAFRDSFAQVAAATAARLGPFLLAGVATDPALMQDDGIHPTAAAQTVMAETVLPALEALLAP